MDAADDPSVGGKAPVVRGEQRWPMALAVIASGLLATAMPADFRWSKEAAYAYPAFLAILLVVLIVGDPGRIDRDRPWLRTTTAAMIAVITVVNALTVVRLVVGILNDASFASAGQLLILGAIVWTTNMLAFSLWFWHLDSGGAAARATGAASTYPAFEFPEMSATSKVPPGWFPTYVDYLALSVNTSLAFGPSDVSALRHWAKLMMICESMISLAVVGLVIATAVNLL